MQRLLKLADTLTKPEDIFKNQIQKLGSPIMSSVIDEPIEYCAFYDETKHAEYDFLSNFYEHPFLTRLGTFRTAEGFYQYQKFEHLNDPVLQEQFMKATGREAFTLSRKHETHKIKTIGGNWEKEKAMKETLKAKFADQALRAKLLATQGAYLVANSPNNTFKYWGDNGNGTGQNRLGNLLMEMRGELGGKGIVPKPSILELLYKKKCELCSNTCHFTNRGLFYNFCHYHMRYELKLGNFAMPINLSDIPEGTGRYLYFNTNEIDGLVTEGTRLLGEHIKKLGLKNPYFITPEVSTIAIAHRLRSDYKIDGTILTKSKKPSDLETYRVEYCAVTSKERKTLYMDKNQAKKLQGKDIVIIDNVRMCLKNLISNRNFNFISEL